MADPLFYGGDAAAAHMSFSSGSGGACDEAVRNNDARAAFNLHINPQYMYTGTYLARAVGEQ
eukprot:NP_508670.1 Uncharacterized protein CELE_F47F2.2 [Caenorhabditis elegans]